jgi:hypothetical protein
MRPIKIDIDPADVDPDGLADNNSSAGATVDLDGALTSGGSFTSADGLAHRLSIIDTGADVQTGATYTFTGLDANGHDLVYSRAGPGSGATVETTAYFLSVTEIAIASPVAGSTVDIGTVDEVEAKAVVVNWRSDHGATVAIAGSVGTYVADIEETFDNLFRIQPQAANWIDKHADKSADAAFTMTPQAVGVRLHLDSYTTGAEFQAHVIFELER